MHQLLMIEDDSRLAQMVGEYLERSGFGVTHAPDARAGLGLLVSQLNNYTLAPVSEERVSEAAGVNSAAGSFGLSFGLAFAGAIMLATLSFAFTAMAEDSSVLPPATSSAWPRPWRTTPRS